jgi:hypothetical protein
MTKPVVNIGARSKELGKSHVETAPVDHVQGD